MALPHLANVLAVSFADERRSAPFVERLRAGGMFDRVWRPAAGWVAASVALPGGPAPVPEDSVAFTEGMERVIEAGERPLRRLDEALERGGCGLVELPGDYGLLRWDSGGELTVVRSCGGLVPCYYTSSETLRAVATRLDLLVRFGLVEVRLDPLVNAIWMAGFSVFPDNRSFLADVRVLPRGHVLRWRGTRPRISCYWDPRPDALRPEPGQQAEHARRLRDLLLAHLDANLDPNGENLVSLSGGVDSSSLAALAAGTLHRPMSSFSLLPQDAAQRRHEESFIVPLTERYGIHRRPSVTLTDQARIDLLAEAPLAGVPVLHPVLCALPALLRERPVSVLVGGEFADEVCGSAFTLPDWLADTPLRWAIRHPRATPFARRNLVKLILRRTGLRNEPWLPLPDRVHDTVRAEVQEEYAEWRRRKSIEAAADPRPLGHLALRCEQEGFVSMNWEATSICGVRRSVPFFTREALELAFACHPTELIGPGTKRLLRTALRSDVPTRNLERQDKGAWPMADQRDQVYAGPFEPGMETVIAEHALGGCSAPLDYHQYLGVAHLAVYTGRLRQLHHEL